MVGCGFVRVAKPVECHFVKLGQLSLALSASADETLQRELSADTYFSSLARIVCRRSASVSWCRERSHWLHTKCMNSGAKPAYCAAKHINHSSDQRSNEAPATNNAVVPRARR